MILCWDRRLATVIGCVDCAMRAFGGAPTYWLTDNERTVTIERVAGVPVRHLEMVAIGGHYGVTIATCVPADPESKGGSEATVRVAKADLVPTDANLRGDYTSWAELVDACDAWMAEVNGREHRVTRRAPVEMLVEEQQRLHRLPEAPYTAVFGETRKVSWNSTVSFGGVTYSVPHALADETVWVRVDGERVAVTHCAPSGPVEVARHQRSTPGHPMIDDAHYPPRPAGPLARRPKPTSAAEAEFLALGEGARLWLVEAASAGTSRIKTKMAQAVDLARLHGQISVDWALGHAATYARFADGDLASILAAHPLGDRDTAGEGPFAAARHTRLGRLRRRPMNPAPIDEVVDLLRTLRLPHMRAAAPDLLATAEAQRWEPAEAMRALLAEERAGRQASSIRARRKAAGFPTAKTFDIWDETVSSIPAPTQRALRTLEWIHRHENLVVCGPSHTPKTHFLEALGQAAVDAGHKVIWFSLEHLGALVRRHSADDTATKAIKRIMRADVIVIDDIGLLPVTTETAEALYRVVDAAYEKRSIALSSNLHPAGFDELMPKTIANATVDRLMHHAHVVLTAGDSIRLTQATAGKGVTPLTN